MTNLSDRIVFITGASSGIGEATARKFALQGARVILVARRKDRLERLTRELTAPTLALPLDVRHQDEVNAAVAGLPAEWQEIDILVNAAGLARGLWKLYEGQIDGWDEMIDTNIKGLLYVSRAVVPGMVTRGRGHIINLGSIAGHELYPGGNVYCATKFAVNALTKGLLMDLVDTPIRVSSIDPGLVETEYSQVRFYGDRERARKVYEGLQPLTGDDIADAIVWVASRPPHVQVAQMVIFPAAQGSAMVVHRHTK